MRPLGGNTYYEVDVKDRLGVPLNHDLSNNCIVEQISAYIVHVEHQGEPIAPPPHLNSRSLVPKRQKMK